MLIPEEPPETIRIALNMNEDSKQTQIVLTDFMKTFGDAGEAGVVDVRCEENQHLIDLSFDLSEMFHCVSLTFLSPISEEIDIYLKLTRIY